MKKSESLLWQRIKKLKLKGQIFRIESNTINGIPDVYWLINGKSIWIELKSNEVKNLGLSKYQINWHLNFQQAGGTVRILNVGTSESRLELLEIRESGVVESLSRAAPSRPFMDNLYHLLVLGSQRWDPRHVHHYS